MAFVQIVFSPTGGTKKVADALAASWQQPLVVDLSDRTQDFSAVRLQQEDVALIAMPSFGGLAPQAALERLCQIQAGGAVCILAAVYGNRAFEDTLIQMADAAKQCGFRVAAAVAAVAEHSIVRRYAAGRPDSDDCAQLAAFAARIDEKLKSGDFSEPALPGNRPVKQASSMSFVPKASGGCSACGLCASLCPVGAIDPAAPRTADKAACIACMRCVSICPLGVRKLNGALVAGASLALKKACAERKENELFL